MDKDSYRNRICASPISKCGKDEESVTNMLLYCEKYNQFRTAPSPWLGPREQGPSKYSQGPGKNNWTDHVPSGLPDENFGILGHFYFLVIIINACLHS